MCLCQRKYALDILEETCLTACKPADTPLPQNHKLALATGPLYADPAQYRHIIGCLIYLTITRPDISYHVHILSQFMQAPCQEHYDILNLILVKGLCFVQMVTYNFMLIVTRIGQVVLFQGVQSRGTSLCLGRLQFLEDKEASNCVKIFCGGGISVHGFHMC